jgi:carbon-monoxide dehydrogenase large subunit
VPFLGAPLKRFEDPRLLRGQATFIEDLELPRMLHVAFVRRHSARSTSTPR